MKTLDTPTETAFVFPPLPTLDSSPAALHHHLLLRGLTHKVNNLLAVIKGNMGLLQMQDTLESTALDHIEETKRACDLLAALGDRVRACAGCSTPEIRPIFAAAALLPLPSFLEKAAAARGVALQTHASPDLPQAIADPGCLRDVVSELVANAIEASPDKSVVSVEILAPGVWDPGEYSHIDVFVRNPAPPIAEREILSFFQPFSTSKGGNHAGMGLNFALALTTQMHIALGVRNSGGSTDFWLRLPVA